MRYSIYKDKVSIETIEYIKNILNDLGIELEETMNEYFYDGENKACSMRVKFFGVNSIGTNGKGSNLNNCKASAYSEFMERLQNQIIAGQKFRLNNKKFNFAPDEKLVPLTYSSILDNYYNKEKIRKYHENFFPNQSQILVPFYNIKKEENCFLPINFVRYLQGSNGMVAGNTPEEALVQGLSEICERYSMKEVFLNDLSLPNIPSVYYKKYDKIVELIKHIEKFGFSIQIKDASLGKKLPVVCTIFKNKLNDFFSVNFGAHPSLPVAIERTLTEFIQGSNFDIKDIKYHIIQQFKENDKVNTGLKLFDLFSRGGKFLSIKNNCFNFISEKSSGDFSKNAWIDEDKEYYTNKTLLKFLINNIYPITNNDIYIRDVSFLNYPSYYIFIPGMSEMESVSLNNLNADYNFVQWINYKKDTSPIHKNIDSLIWAVETKINDFRSKIKKNEISFVVEEYIALLCYIVKKDILNIIKYSDIILHSNLKDLVKDLTLIKLIYEYYSLKLQNNNEEDIIENLKSKFELNDFNRFLIFDHYLTFERIKKILKDANIVDLDNEICEKIRIIKDRLIDKYINNVPNQINLKNVFEHI